METRRALLRALALGLGVTAAFRGARGQPAERAVYVGMETDPATGRSRAAFFTASGARAGAVPLDFRAHGTAQHGSRLVVFPRRPGTRFTIVDVATLAIGPVVTAPPGRHFYGHGAFTADGAHLLVTENDTETLQGGIGIYAAGDTSGSMARLDQIALPGPGPHEIVALPGGRQFLIAIGGLQTHPDYGRTILNLGAFRSQIVVLDAATGELTGMGHWPGSEGVSLRHLARDGRGRLYVGGQIPDPAQRASAGGQVLWLVDGEEAVPLSAGAALGGYVSSVAAHGTRALVTSKIAHRVLTLDGATVTGAAQRDGASAAALGPGLQAASGYVELGVNGAILPAGTGLEFDNHGAALRPAPA